MVSSNQPWSNEWTVPLKNKADGVFKVVLDEVLEEMDRHGFTSREIFGVHMAVEDALVNVVKSQPGADSLRIVCRITDEQTEVDIELHFLDGMPPAVTRMLHRKTPPPGTPVPSGAPWSKEWIVPLGPNPKAAAKTCLDEVLAALEEQKFSQKDIFSVHMALEEALVKAIALPEKPHALRVTCQVTHGRAELNVEPLFSPPPSAPWGPSE